MMLNFISTVISEIWKAFLQILPDGRALVVLVIVIIVIDKFGKEVRELIGRIKKIKSGDNEWEFADPADIKISAGGQAKGEATRSAAGLPELEGNSRELQDFSGFSGNEDIKFHGMEIGPVDIYLDHNAKPIEGDRNWVLIDIFLNANRRKTLDLVDSVKYRLHETYGSDREIIISELGKPKKAFCLEGVGAYGESCVEAYVKLRTGPVLYMVRYLSFANRFRQSPFEEESTFFSKKYLDMVEQQINDPASRPK